MAARRTRRKKIDPEIHANMAVTDIMSVFEHISAGKLEPRDLVEAIESSDKAGLAFFTTEYVAGFLSKTARKCKGKNSNALGEALRQQRIKKLKKTLRDMEGIVGIPNAHLSQIETGNISSPNVTTLKKLAKGYRIAFKKVCELAGMD